MPLVFLPGSGVSSVSRQLQFLRVEHLSQECFVKSVFHHCDKIPEVLTCKEGRFLLAYSFRGFSSWWLGLLTLGSVDIGCCGGSTWQRRPVHFMESRKQRVRSSVPFKATPLVT